MRLTAIDHAIIAVTDLEGAAEPWHRLGLTPTLGTRHAGQGTENAVLFFGDSPESMFYLEFLAVHDPEAAARTARGRRLLEAIDGGEGLFRLVLATDDIEEAGRDLVSARVPFALAGVHREDGSKICEVLTMHGDEESSIDPRLIQYVDSRAARFETRTARGLFHHTFDLARLDHVAMVPLRLEETTRFWVDVLGVPVSGEVRARELLIRQMQVGDAVVEFLAPAGPGSRLAGAPPGLRSVVAFEVDDLDVAVQTVRERGFEPTDPAEGVLPGTRTSTVPGAQLSGVALQLLEYE